MNRQEPVRTMAMERLPASTAKLIREVQRSLLPVICQYRPVGVLGELPRLAGIYFCFAPRADRVVYVGMTSSLKRRWGNHGLRFAFERSLIRLRWKRADFEKHPEARFFASLEEEESFFISTLRPKWNRSWVRARENPWYAAAEKTGDAVRHLTSEVWHGGPYPMPEDLK